MILGQDAVREPAVDKILKCQRRGSSTYLLTNVIILAIASMYLSVSEPDLVLT